jgi:HAD superfamily hydrolase (TIGR01509 family)
LKIITKERYNLFLKNELEKIEKFLPQGAVFDMDGLMLDTERPSLRAWKKVGEKWGFPITEDIVFRTIGIAENASKKIYFEKFGEDFPYDAIRAESKRVLDDENEREGVRLRPGLLVLLDKFAELDVPLAVATSTSKERAVWKLKKTGLYSRFSAFAFGDEVERGKPAPDIFLLALKRLNREPAFCVGFEDSPAGLAGLHAANIRSVFVKDLLEPAPEILKTVWYRAQDLAEAAGLFG